MITRAFVLKILMYVILSIIAVAIGTHLLAPPQRLPIFNPVDLNPYLVDPEFQKIGRNYKVGGFEAVAHTQQSINQDWVKGKIYTVSFFFTTCPSICIDMTREMKALQTAYGKDPSVQMLSFSVMPEVDSPEVLATYAQLNGIEAPGWLLLHTTQAEIQRLARKVFFVVRENPGDDDDSHDFIHTENVVLVDVNGRLRGFYDGTSAAEMQKLVEDIKILKREMKL
jgi:protein SCO1/2